jgi:hypothetical protein
MRPVSAKGNYDAGVRAVITEIPPKLASGEGGAAVDRVLYRCIIAA